MKTKFTKKMRKELCGGYSYCVANSSNILYSQSVNLIDALDFEWDGRKDPYLKDVIEGLVALAYYRGAQDCKKKISNDLGVLRELLKIG